MRTKCFLAAGAVALTALLWAAAGPGQYPSLAGTDLPLRAKNSGAAALTGQVSSQEEGPMEGVLVSAKGAGTAITVTVVSDSQGRYSFPRTKLQPGRYALSIRAVGYNLESPAVVDIPPNQTAPADLRLAKTADLSTQLTSAEWIMSAPGTEEQKAVFRGCTGCHSVERIVKSKHDATEFVAVQGRMSTYAPPSSVFRVVRMPGGPGETANPETRQKRAEYLATVNLSSGPWKYALQTLPRPKGNAVRVIITEYDLPRKNAQPHDVAMGPDGMIWYSDFADPYLGRLNPRTAEIKEYAVPQIKAGFPPGSLDVEFDKEGNVWLGRLLQGGVARFDPRTEKFDSWSVPREYNNNAVQTAMVAPQNHDYDGKVWFDNASANRVLHRLDLKTGQVETVEPYREIGKDSPDGSREHSTYGIATDAQNNLYFTDMAGGNIGRIDAKSGKVTLLPTPAKNSGPRRIRMDSQGRLWFGESSADKIGMLDPVTGQFREWAVPSPWSNPYDVVLDKNEDAWTGSTFNDRVLRLNVKTGQWTEYLLPRYTNIRRVFVDNSTTPVTFWVGNNHGASIIKLEPLE